MKTHECLLINPRSAYHYIQTPIPYPPASLLTIASFLERSGVSSFVLDMVAEEDPVGLLSRHLDAAQGGVLLVGFTVMTSQVRHAAELSRHVKTRYPGTRVIWGGIHPTLFPEQVLREGVADFVCVGEGEYTTQELLAALRGNSDPRSVKGLYFLSGGELVFTGRRAPNDLDSLPFLNYHLIDYSKYRVRSVGRGREAMRVNSGVIISSVGCPYRCTFCVNANKRLAFGGYRTKSAGRLADELAYLTREFGLDYFDFLDENFFVRRDHPENFANEIKKRGLKFNWYTSMRADAFDRKLVDEPLLERLKDVGLYYLSIGAESGSQRILDKLKKEITVAQIRQSAELIVKHGLGVTFSFMMGLPGEEQSDTDATLLLIQKLRALDSKVSIIGPQIFRPYPGGELYDECVQKYGYQQPQTVAGWSESVVPLTGFEDVEKLVWIPDKEYIRKVSFYMDFVNINIDAFNFGPLKKLAFKVLKATSNFRIRHQLWGFNLDMRLIMAYKKMTHTVRDPANG